MVEGEGQLGGSGIELWLESFFKKNFWREIITGVVVGKYGILVRDNRIVPGVIVNQQSTRSCMTLVPKV